jgi:hypothetical protein
LLLFAYQFTENQAVIGTFVQDAVMNAQPGLDEATPAAKRFLDIDGGVFPITYENQ